MPAAIVIILMFGVLHFMPSCSSIGELKAMKENYDKLQIQYNNLKVDYDKIKKEQEKASKNFKKMYE